MPDVNALRQAGAKAVGSFGIWLCDCEYGHMAMKHAISGPSPDDLRPAPQYRWSDQPQGRAEEVGSDAKVQPD